MDSDEAVHLQGTLRVEFDFSFRNKDVCVRLRGYEWRNLARKREIVRYIQLFRAI